jgi:hypothetical protein
MPLFQELHDSQYEARFAPVNLASLIGAGSFDDGLVTSTNESFEKPAASAKPAKKSRAKAKPKTYIFDLSKREKPVESASLPDVPHWGEDTTTEIETDGVYRFKDLYPSYLLGVRLIRASIDDYLEDPVKHRQEIGFWRSPLFCYYGQIVCDMQWVLFQSEVSLESLRRGAEKKMGLPRYALDPEGGEQAQQAKAARIAFTFRYIAEEFGHLPDPKADAAFKPRRRKST